VIAHAGAIDALVIAVIETPFGTQAMALAGGASTRRRGGTLRLDTARKPWHK
jgi:hypothetical protein